MSERLWVDVMKDIKDGGKLSAKELRDVIYLLSSTSESLDSIDPQEHASAIQGMERMTCLLEARLKKASPRPDMPDDFRIEMVSDDFTTMVVFHVPSHGKFGATECGHTEDLMESMRIVYDRSISLERNL